MGRKAILDAADVGFAFLRVEASGYAPADLALWRTDPAEYWRRLDAMFDDLDGAGVRIVPVFLFNPFQFPAMAGETLATMLRDPASQSRRLLQQYIAALIGRYGTRPTILFYELTNELNLEADIDIAGLCRQRHPASCAAYADFTSATLTAFARAMVGFIKARDPSRQVGSGYALPRPAAFHLARRPSFAPGGPDWTVDSPAQFRSHLAAISAPFDLWSIHLYPGDVRFGNKPGSEARTLAEAAAAARQVGRRLYVGEFGDGLTETPFLQAALRGFAADGVAYAAVWVWEFYQVSPWQSADVTSRPPQSLEPGWSDALDTLLAHATGHDRTALPAAAPRLVLTAPLACRELHGPLDLYAVASADTGPVAGVSFEVNGKPVGTATSVPYHVHTVLVGPGPGRVGATASAGGRSTARVEIMVRLGPTDPCAVRQAQPGK